jgi:hypothetical protein
MTGVSFFCWTFLPRNICIFSPFHQLVRITTNRKSSAFQQIISAIPSRILIHKYQGERGFATAFGEI